MKKFIYISGILSANLMLFGSLFKVLHMPGASILLLLSVFMFCFIFLPMALYNNYVNQDEKKSAWLYIVTFIVFFVCILGALFKIMHWPGASVFLVLGILSPFVLFLPVYLYQTRKPKSKSVKNNLAVMFGLTFLAVFNVFLAVNVSSDVLNSVALAGYNQEEFVKSLGNKSDVSTKSSIKLKALEISNYIEKLKQEAASEGLADNEHKVSNYSALTIADKGAPAISIFVKNGTNPKSQVEVLKIQMDEFSDMILNSERISPELKELTNTLLVFNEDAQLWITKEFPIYQKVYVYNALCRIQSNVLFVGSECSN